MSTFIKHFTKVSLNLVSDWYFKKPLEVIDFFRDRITEISFMCFISYAAEDYDALAQYREWFRKVLLATILIINPNLTFNLVFEEFWYNPTFRNFVKQHPYLNKLLEDIAKKKEEGAPELDLNDALTLLVSMPPFSFIASILGRILGDPLLYSEEWAQHLWSFVEQAKGNILTACTNILNKFKDVYEEVQGENIARDVVVKICPYLAYFVPQVLAWIKLYDAYCQVKPRKEKIFNLAELLKVLPADLYLDDNYKATKTLSTNGTVEFKLGKGVEFNKVLIDVLGLQAVYIKTLEEILKRFKFFYYEDNKWYAGDDPNYYIIREEEYDVGKGYRVGYELGSFIGCKLDGQPYDDLEMFIVMEPRPIKIWIFGSRTAWDIDVYFDDEFLVKCPKGHKYFCPSMPINFDEAVYYMEL